MDQSHAVVGADVIVVEHGEAPLRGEIGEAGEEGFVFPAFEGGTFHFGNDFESPFLAEDGAETRFGHDVAGPGVVGEVPHDDVIDIGPGADRQVFGERPRGGGPDEEIGRPPGGIRARSDFCPDGDRGVLNVLVVAPRLEVREGGGELPRVGHDPVGFVDPSLIPELFEHPPDALHVAGLHGLVIVVEIDPAAHARHGVTPFADVAGDHGAALLVEFVHAETLYLVGAGDAEGVLGEGLDGQAVAVPAETALHVLPAHGAVAGDDVLDRSREEVAVVGQSGGEGGAVVEDELFAAAALVQRLFESIVFFPEREDLLLELREIDLIGDVGKSHG